MSSVSSPRALQSHWFNPNNWHQNINTNSEKMILEPFHSWNSYFLLFRLPLKSILFLSSRRLVTAGARFTNVREWRTGSPVLMNQRAAGFLILRNCPIDTPVYANLVTVGVCMHNVHTQHCSNQHVSSPSISLRTYDKLFPVFVRLCCACCCFLLCEWTVQELWTQAGLETREWTWLKNAWSRLSLLKKREEC